MYALLTWISVAFPINKISVHFWNEQLIGLWPNSACLSSSATLWAFVGQKSTVTTRSFGFLIRISPLCRLKSFCGMNLPETIRYTNQLYTSAILMVFRVNTEYHFFPLVTCLKWDNEQSGRLNCTNSLVLCSINCELLNVLFPFFFYLFLCTSYWLHTIHIISLTVTTEFQHLTISILPSILKSKDPLSFFVISLT